MFPGVACLFLVVRGVWEKLWEVGWGVLTLRSGSPIDIESVHCRHQSGSAVEAGLILSSLRRSRRGSV
jgi:hypothetical protein